MKLFGRNIVSVCLALSLFTATCDDDTTEESSCIEKPAYDADAPASISLEFARRYTVPNGWDGGAEIAAYDAGSQKIFFTNGTTDSIDILDLSDPAAPSLLSSIDITEYGDGVQSVAAFGGIVVAAISVEAASGEFDYNTNGKLVFFDTDGNYVSEVTSGALPDMVTFSPDGCWVLSANEGEPADDYSVDPEGSVTIVDISEGVEDLTDKVTLAEFTAFNGETDFGTGARITGLSTTTVAEDLEPEYIAVSPDSTTAYVSLQENNMIATVDIATGEVTSLDGLGFKDFSETGVDINKDDGINIRNFPVYGVYQPDAIAAYDVDGTTYIVTANEGDDREYDQGDEEVVDEVKIDETSFISPTLIAAFNGSDLTGPFVTAQDVLDEIDGVRVIGDLGNGTADGTFDALYTYGARSFSIYAADSITQVYDSGGDFETTIAGQVPEGFNVDSDLDNGEAIETDDRSDNKGPEPEGVSLGFFGDKVYAFIGIEKVGGVMVYEITDPENPEFIEYQVDRDFSVAPTEENLGTFGDSGPEGIVFIPSSVSGNGNNLLVVTNEVSGTITIYNINKN